MSHEDFFNKVVKPLGYQYAQLWFKINSNLKLNNLLCILVINKFKNNLIKNL